jgi:hypothetical protein
MIRPRGVTKNGNPVMENNGIDPIDFLDQIYERSGFKYPRFYKMDNLGKLGFLASEILLQGSDMQRYSPEDVGVVLCNASASLDTDIRYYKTVQEIPSPALFVYTLPNIVIGEICIRNQFKGENAFFVFREMNVPFITQYVKNLMNNNILRCCICGWMELLEKDYKAVLFLVENSANNPVQGLLFEEETISKLYESANG